MRQIFQRGLILMETENIKKKYFATIEETDIDEEGRVILAEESPVEQPEETAEEIEEVAEAIEEVTEEEELGEEANRRCGRCRRLYGYGRGNGNRYRRFR